MTVYVVKHNGEHLDEIAGVFSTQDGAEGMINGNPEVRYEIWDVDDAIDLKFKKVYNSYINLFSGGEMHLGAREYWYEHPLRYDFTNWGGVIMIDRTKTHDAGLMCQAQSTVSAAAA